VTKDGGVLRDLYPKCTDLFAIVPISESSLVRRPSSVCTFNNLALFLERSNLSSRGFDARPCLYPRLTLSALESVL
jgi:hypothetical protein